MYAIKPCKNCDQSYRPNSGHSLFCSDRCRKLNRNIKEREKYRSDNDYRIEKKQLSRQYSAAHKVLRILECVTCGKSFTPVGRQLCCSKKCTEYRIKNDPKILEKKKISNAKTYEKLKGTPEGRELLKTRSRKANKRDGVKEYRNNFYRSKRKNDKCYREKYNLISKEYNLRFKQLNGATYQTIRCRKDPIFAVTRNISRRLNTFLKTKGLEKNHPIGEYVGESSNFLRDFITQQFELGMNWNNYGVVWHLDHVRPLKSFDFNDVRQIYVANNWRNLQPLFVQLNLEKSDKYTLENESNWIRRMHKYQFEGDLFLKFSN